MNAPNKIQGAIPVSPTLAAQEPENFPTTNANHKKRLVTISLLAIGIAAVISFIARFLVGLINGVTNLSFHGTLSFSEASPLGHHLGLWVIGLPVVGGLIVGLMAYYGSKAIRGHGIPEAMEQVLTNHSRIKPAITWLKPVSSAIAIGTGGPFGAEGPIIATGGAFGSTMGQMLHITHNERKILLAAGATAGMSAIFGTPLAAIFLAIELLLFEFSPRAILPVALACITGAAGHHFLFEEGPVFPLSGRIEAPSNTALFAYSLMGLVIGLLSVGVTKIVYLIEDAFEKLPLHWMWWPAIGGLAVGVVGYFYPRTLSVGYNNITDLLNGSLTLQVVIALCVFKFVSWAISLGSGTSGGTLAPLLTIGGATGSLLGSLVLLWFPHSGVSLPLAALVGMSCMFAGASRALLTSIVFALETTGQGQALLPLLAACTGAYIVSFLLMENTIMTEKIGRRGVKTPVAYQPDLLEKLTVMEVMKTEVLVLSENNTVGEVVDWMGQEEGRYAGQYVVAGAENQFRGIIPLADLLGNRHQPGLPIARLTKWEVPSLSPHRPLRAAVELMARQEWDVLPVVTGDNTLVGVLSYKDTLAALNRSAEESEKKTTVISLKHRGLKLLVRGQRIMRKAQ
ncbi:chloride channel protein [Paraflavisolibacter sp. H34]|uniref:chloride channel protein n=1 Tax=Huijunlia imazamoxiresistens TaxID=3127457 RepID=UPI00301A7DC7